MKLLEAGMNASNVSLDTFEQKAEAVVQRLVTYEDHILPLDVALENMGAFFSERDGAKYEITGLWKGPFPGQESILPMHLEAKLFAAHSRLRLESFEQNNTANDFYKSQGWVAGKSFIDSETGIAMVTLEKSRSVAD